jgi:hypothetical protein
MVVDNGHVVFEHVPCAFGQQRHNAGRKVRQENIVTIQKSYVGRSHCRDARVAGAAKSAIALTDQTDIAGRIPIHHVVDDSIGRVARPIVDHDNINVADVRL